MLNFWKMLIFATMMPTWKKNGIPNINSFIITVPKKLIMFQKKKTAYFQAVLNKEQKKAPGWSQLRKTSSKAFRVLTCLRAP